MNRVFNDDRPRLYPLKENLEYEKKLLYSKPEKKVDQEYISKYIYAKQDANQVYHRKKWDSFDPKSERLRGRENIRKVHRNEFDVEYMTRTPEPRPVYKKVARQEQLRENEMKTRLKKTINRMDYREFPPEKNEPDKKYARHLAIGQARREIERGSKKRFLPDPYIERKPRVVSEINERNLPLRMARFIPTENARFSSYNWQQQDNKIRVRFEPPKVIRRLFQPSYFTNRIKDSSAALYTDNIVRSKYRDKPKSFTTENQRERIYHRTSADVTGTKNLYKKKDIVKLPPRQKRYELEQFDYPEDESSHSVRHIASDRMISKHKPMRQEANSYGIEKTVELDNLNIFKKEIIRKPPKVYADHTRFNNFDKEFYDEDLSEVSTKGYLKVYKADSGMVEENEILSATQPILDVTKINEVKEKKDSIVLDLSSRKNMSRFDQKDYHDFEEKLITKGFKKNVSSNNPNYVALENDKFIRNDAGKYTEINPTERGHRKNRIHLSQKRM